MASVTETGTAAPATPHTPLVDELEARASGRPAGWYFIAEPADALGLRPAISLDNLDSSTLADVIRQAADELARRGWWNDQARARREAARS